MRSRQTIICKQIQCTPSTTLHTMRPMYYASVSWGYGFLSVQKKKAMNVNRNGIMWMSERNRNKFTFDFKIAKKKSNGVDIIPICERYMWTSMRYVERVQRTIAIVCDHRSHVRRIRFLSPQTKVCCTMITRYILYKNLWARACASVPYTHTHVCVFI